jgi:hypothetical protein
MARRDGHRPEGSQGGTTRVVLRPLGQPLGPIVQQRDGPGIKCCWQLLANESCVAAADSGYSSMLMSRSRPRPGQIRIDDVHFGILTVVPSRARPTFNRVRL